MNRSIKALKKKRHDWRKGLGNSGALSDEEYRERIRIHVDTLNKYISQFHSWIAVWAARNKKNSETALKIFGDKRWNQILDGARPGIYEILMLYSKIDVRPDFISYLINKTHLSYEMYPYKPVPIKSIKVKPEMRSYHKFAEFVVIILAEYVVLHNYAFCGKMRTEDMNTIDSWMVKI